MTGQIVAVVEAPIIKLDEGEHPTNALLKFYYALGWNGEDAIDPCKIRITEAVYYRICDVMMEHLPENTVVGAFMVDKAPSVDKKVPHGKVCLLAGWCSKEDTNF